MLKPRQHISRNILLLSPPQILSPSISNHRRTTHQVIDSCHFLHSNPYSQSYCPISQLVLPRYHNKTKPQSHANPRMNHIIPHTDKTNNTRIFPTWTNPPQSSYIRPFVHTYIHYIHVLMHMYVYVDEKHLCISSILNPSTSNKQHSVYYPWYTSKQAYSQILDSQFLRICN